MEQLLDRQSAVATGTLSTTRRAPAADPRWQLAQRIAGSGTLGRSRLLADFLLYIVDRQISDREDEITEQQIGVRVFGRPEGYDSNEDNIVRSYARNLRKRLEEYFAQEGSQETLRMEIPRGGYVPVFFEPNETLVEEEAVADDAPTPARGFPRSLLFVVCLVIMTAVGGLAGYLLGHERFRPLTPAARINHLFWSGLFESRRDTFIVPTDGGLVMLERFIKGHVSLEDYASGVYQKDSSIAEGIVGLVDHTTAADTERLRQKIGFLGRRRYTSLADLELTTGLARLNEVVPERLLIRYARDLRMDDLRTGNAILIGSIDSNPWVDLFQQQLNFQFLPGAAFGGSGTIVNRHPLAGEQTSYASVPNDPLSRTYGVAAYVPNLEGTGHVLLIEGINMAGTQAAGTFLLSPASMQPVLERAMGPDGAIRPFEVLFETSSVAANASRTKILSMRFVAN